MTHIQSVLAATDFSPDSRHAAERAAMLGTTLAMQKGLLLHVLEQSWLDSLKQFISSPTEIRDGIIDDASGSLRKLAEEARLLSGFSLEPQVRLGSTLDLIVETASEYDLLVLGAHGRHPVRALALGTTSQRLLSKTRKSVLVVKCKPDGPYRRVLVAVDFSPNSRKAMEYGSMIAPGQLVNLVHVFEPLVQRQMIPSCALDQLIQD
jgi:nucleotide-binding universal stress UspA family protein